LGTHSIIWFNSMLLRYWIGAYVEF